MTQDVVFAYACRAGAVGITDAKAVLGRGALDAESVLGRLVTQTLLVAVEPNVRWDLAPHLQARFLAGDAASDQPGGQVPADTASLVTDQPAPHSDNLVTPKLTKLTDHQRRIIELCEVPRKQAHLMQKIGLTHRNFFQRKHLGPLIQAGLIRMTHPDDPNHPNQAYVVTEAGLGFLSSGESETEDTHGEA